MGKRSSRKERYLKIALPENVKTIINTLEEHGYEAFAVGGCVRDSLLGRVPEDWDITTSALPADIKKCFRRTVDTGIEHGTVTVLIGDDSYEVTTYRIDGEYKDSRHPSEVVFTDAVSEDLRRRDFTINAMAYNDEKGFVDLFGGRDDLKRRVIRCVGNADDRFTEDALRILRAIRFAAQLDFDIDAATRNAIADHAPNLKAVSKERILVELSKLVCSAHIEKAADIPQLGVIPYIAKHFREINIAQLMGLKTSALRLAGYDPDGDAAENEIDPHEDAFDLCKATTTGYRYIRFAFLCQGMKPENVDELMKDLKSDNITRKNAVLLTEWTLKPLPSDKYELKKIMSGMSPEIFMDLLRVKLSSLGTMLYKKLCKDEDIRAVIDSFNEIAGNEEPVYMTDLAVGGADLKAAGVAEGPQLGSILNKMLDHVWKKPEDNDKEKLIGMFA
ncbi:MAG: CCA tRNA nucleotidyltransferase [Eubacteriales bacterium]|nr:CCA tRNA nucleotidyltransferase [Eubacteriales bacterium]